MKHYYQHIILPNGAQIYMIEMEGVQSCYINIMQRAGFRYETEQETGLGHMIEHLIVNARDINFLSKIPYANAFTALNITWYELECSSADYEQHLDILTNNFINITFEPKKVKEEMRVHLREIDYHGKSKNFNDKYSGLSFYKGVKEKANITFQVSPQKLKKYYEKYYHPKNTSYLITGGFDRKKVIEIISKYNKTSNGIPFNYLKTIEDDYQKYSKLLKNNKYQYNYINNKSGLADCYLIFMCPSLNKYKDYKEIIIQYMISELMYILIFKQLRINRMAIYSPHTYSNLFYPKNEFIINFPTTDHELKTCINDVVKILKNVKQEVDDELFNDVKKNILYQEQIKLNNPVKLMEILRIHLEINNSLTYKPDEMISIIQTITKNELIEYMNSIFIKKNLTLEIYSNKNHNFNFTL